MKEEGFFQYLCAYCGAENETFVDDSAGARQRYTEDCTVCCRPNVLSITLDPLTGAVSVEAVFEG